MTSVVRGGWGLAGVVFVVGAAVGCGAEPDAPAALDASSVALPDAPSPDAPSSSPDVPAPDAARLDVPAPDAARPDVPAPDVARDATRDSFVDVRPDAPAPDAPRDGGATASGTAPAGAVEGERALGAGTTTVTVPTSGEAVYRFEAMPGEHVGLRLTFSPTTAVVAMAVDRWDGARAVTLGTDRAGAGLRTLAVLDPGGPRTFWVRLRATGTAPRTASLAVTRTAFEDGARCATDCARLLQLPLPNSARVDGYAVATNTVFRYQFGRRDLVMFLRRAGREMARAGSQPFVPEDLSQWNGETPGVDVGRPRHASHQRGKDVDISLYGLDGEAPWRTYCTVVSTSGGRECRAGTARNYDGPVNARLFGLFFDTGRVTMSFLDRELIAATRSGLPEASRQGWVAASLLPLYADGRHLQHWPNHDNHIHLRVSEATPGAIVYEPFEAP